MTFGYRTDDLAVRSLLGRTFAYIGIMGSRKKILQMFQACRQEGIPEIKMQGLHASIGLDIKSQTPAEIAFRIAAEIIQVKNRIL